MKQIVAMRVKEQCSQAMLAERTGWSQGAISSYEMGKKKVPLAYVEAALAAFGRKLQHTKKGDDE